MRNFSRWLSLNNGILFPEVFYYMKKIIRLDGKFLLLLLGIALTFLFSKCDKIYGWGREDVGTSGAAFLKIGVGARPASMGDAFIASGDDINSVFHNPAGLTDSKDFEFTAQYGAYFQSINHNALAVSKKLGSAGFLSIGVVNLSVDKIERRSSDTALPDEFFAAGDYAYMAGFARGITPRITLGANLKYISLRIDDKTAGAPAADVGIKWKPVIKGKEIFVGAAVSNIGTEIKFNQTADPLPLTAAIGVAARFLGDDLLVAADVVSPRDNNVSFNTGVEYSRPVKSDIKVSARAGYKSGLSSDEKLGGLAGLSGGAGISYRQFIFDFAWIPYGLLGDTFKYALSVRF